MTPVPETSESLLIRIRDPNDQAAWRKFDAIYRPVVYRVARRQGWQDCDAQDLAQRVMMSVARAIPSWERDHQKAGFRSWLNRVARNTLISIFRKNHREFSMGGCEYFEQTESLEAPPDELSELIDREHQRRRLCLAAEQIRQEFKESSWQAFWLTTLEDRSVVEAAQSLGLSVGAVYSARSRIMRRLQEVAQSLDSDD